MKKPLSRRLYYAWSQEHRFIPLPLTRAKLFFVCTGKQRVIVVEVNAVQQSAHFLKSTLLKNIIGLIRVKHSI